MKLVPFTAVAAAGTVNVFLMRGKEIRHGIDVYDEDNNPVGKSKVAGFAAVSQVGSPFSHHLLFPLMLTT
jgi:hypothetical protein